MSTNKEKKKIVIDKTAESFKGASGIIITDYQGLKAGQVNDLRRRLEKAGASYRVVKNTLSKKVIDDLKVDASLKPLFKGVTGLVFSTDYISAIKALTAFAKENEKFKIKGGIIDAKPVSVEDIKVLSALPTKQELIAKFVVLLNSPIQRFVNVLDRAGKTAKEAIAEVKAEAKEAAAEVKVETKEATAEITPEKAN
jgi:large subunit ribosomal protein L10